MEKKKLYLPHELIVEILMRLPVKSLICFKCVSKSWYSLISDPHFSNSQFQLTAATHTPKIMCISVSPPEIRSIDFERFVNDDPDHASLNINFWLPQTDFPIEIKGSCRGFIFLYCRPYIYLWNPSTGFKKQIHVSPFDTKRARSKHSNHIYGFGYDQLRDDYLVVVLSHQYSEENPFSSHLEIFSNRDNKWKEIEGTHFPYHGPQIEGLLFNGAIHWLVFRTDFEIDVIVAFDLMERKLFEIPLPDVFHQHVSVASSLWAFGEFFSLWTTDYDNRTVEIWVMKEYKLNSSWTKTHVLLLDVDPLTLKAYNDFYFKPICSTNNGDIIGINHRSRLVKYNDKGQRLGHHFFCNSPSDIVMYTESLISLPGDNEQFIN